MSEARKRFITLADGGETAVLERLDGDFADEPDYEWLCRCEDLGKAQRIVAALERQWDEDDGADAAATGVA